MAGKFDMQIILIGFEQISDHVSKSSSVSYFFSYFFLFNMMEGTWFGLFDKWKNEEIKMGNGEKTHYIH